MADGARLALKIWLPPDRQTSKAVIVAIHGFNDYSRAFTLPAATWAGQGIVTYAYDQRGFGGNPNPGRWPGSRSLCLDIATTVSLVQARWPMLPVYLLGESMGGAEVMDLMAGTCGVTPPQPAGVILVAPAVWTRASMSFFQRGALWAAVRVAPGLTLTGRGLHILASDNIPMLRKFSADPMVIKETRVDAIDGLCDLMDEASALAPRLTAPTLVLYGDHDQVIPRDPLMAMVKTLPNATLKVYPDGYHMMLRDLDAEEVLAGVAAWIGQHGGPEITEGN